MGRRHFGKGRPLLIRPWGRRMDECNYAGPVELDEVAAPEPAPLATGTPFAGVEILVMRGSDHALKARVDSSDAAAGRFRRADSGAALTAAGGGMGAALRGTLP